MSKRNTQLLMVGLSFAAVGFALVSYRNCNKGCQNLAQHLIEHGVQDIVLSLF
jgi:hypothetical protein